MNLENIIKFVKNKAAPAVLALTTSVYAFGCGGENGNGENHDPAPIDQTSIEPANGSSYNVGDVIPVSFLVPSDEDGDSLTGTVVVTGDTDGVPGISADDFVREYDVGTVTSGTSVTQDVNTDDFPAEADGTGYNIEVIVSDGNGGSSTADVDVTLVGESSNPVRVTGCYVQKSTSGTSLAMQCNGESDNGEITGFNLTGGPDGVMIGSSGTIITPRVMEASDVGLHTYNVTCTDGTNTSDTYTFTVPVDEHDSILVLHCQGDSDENMLLPETSVDAIAEQCGDGFNATLKPDTGADPEYILDVDHTCVQGVIASLSAAEREAHNNYNVGVTVDDVYTDCTVDFAQVKYLGN